MLVVATGAVLVPEETEGLTGPGWMEKVFTFYTPEGAAALRAALAAFDGGRSWSTSSTCRSSARWPARVLLPGRLVLPRARHPRPRRADLRHAARRRVHQAGGVRDAGRDARREGDRARHRVQHRRGRRSGRSPRLLRRTGGRLRPRRRGAAPRRRRLRRPLAGARRRARLRPDRRAHLQSKLRPNMFAIGDAADVPTSKAGSVTHFEGEVLVENMRRFLAGEPLDASFDGHTNCFIETGFNKALLIDFNYETEPLPGHFPSRCRPAAAEGVPAQPPRQADVPVALLAQPAARARHPRASRRPCPAPASIRRRPSSEQGGAMTMRPAIAGGRRRRSTTRDSSRTPTSGPRRWRPRSPDAKGIEELTDRALAGHQVHARRVRRKGTGPTVRVLGKTSGVPIKELYQLFPKGPAKLAAKIAGIPKPRGCI